MTTVRFRNVSPMGALEVPALGRVIERGEEFEVAAEHAALFAAQVRDDPESPGNYEPVNDEAIAAVLALAPDDETAADAEEEVEA